MQRFKIYLVLFIIAKSVSVLAQPVITSFNPQSGPIGTLVTVTGSNFSPTANLNIVYFGAVRVTVASSTATSLTVYVPQGVNYEPIAVTVAGFTAYSTKSFIVTRSAPLTLSSSSFGIHNDFAVTTSPDYISLADYDFNGVADIAVSTSLTSKYNFSAYRNTSDCKNLSLAAQQDFFTNDVTPLKGLATADFDGDGKLDAAISTASNNRITVFQNLSFIGTLSFNNGLALGVTLLPTGDVKIADMDGDGKPDVVVALFNSLVPDGGLAIYRNVSTGAGSFSFSVPQLVNFNANPKNIALSDIDGDGKLDIIISDGTSTVRVRRNNSVSGTLKDASFDAEVSFTTAATPQDVSAGDIDGDGKTDLVIACASAISILRNTATSGVITASSFSAKVDFTLITSGSIDLGDLNGDGKVDIAVSDGLHVAVFQNQAASGAITAGSLATNINFSLGGTASVKKVAIADMNSDGYLDIVATQSGNFFSVFLYTPPVTPPPTITSFTNSGLINSSLTINGTNFGASTATNQVFFGAVKATITSASTTKLVVNVPPYATFGPITVENLTTNLSVGSLTNFTPLFDNNKDFGGRIIPASMDFKKDLSLGVSGNAQSVSLADLDSDGFSDLIVPQTSDSLTIFRNKGNGLLTSAGFEKFRLSSGAGVGNHQAIASDIDGDGKLDIVMIVRISDTDGALIYRNLSTAGSLLFAPSYLVSLPFLTINNGDLAVGDMDADGKPDLLLEASGKISVFKNNSLPGSFCFAPKVDIVGGGRGISLGDIDGDGKLDIAVARGYYSVAGFQLIHNTSTIGTLSFDTPVSFAPPNAGNINSVVLSDLDSDGKPDISWVGVVGASYGLHVMKNVAASGTIDATSLGADVTYGGGTYAITSATYSQVADINGDGKPDFIGIGSPTGGFSISENVTQNGVIDSNSFLEGVAFLGDATNTYSSQYPAIGDLDGDGKPEVIVSTFSYSPSKISIYKNLSYPAPRIDLLKNNSVSTNTGSISTPLFTQGDYQFTNSDSPTIRFGATASTVTSSTNIQVATTVPLGASNERVAITLHGLTGFSPLPFSTTFPVKGMLDATTFATKVDYALVTSATQALAVSDFDNDGKPDLVTGDGGSINVMKSNLPSAGAAISTSTFSALLPEFGYGIGTLPITVGDYDGDGFTDLQANSSLWRNNSGTQANPISFEAGVQALGGGGANASRPKTNIDFNHDGKTDLVSVYTGFPSSNVAVNENRSRKGSFVQSNFPTFNDAVKFNITGTLSEATAGDFDGDGYDDIACLNKSGNQLQYMLNQKLNRAITLAQFGVPQSIATDASPDYLITQDFDQDGKLDIAVAYTTIATVSVFKNTSTPGAISFTKQDFVSLANAVKIDAADLDGDGKAEIVTIHGINAGPYNFSILKNTSTTGISFASKIDYTVPTQPLGLALADLNLDAKADILITRNGPFLSIFQNQLELGAAITITTQPTTTTTCIGGTASFAVMASGTTNITYQWQKLNTTNNTFENINNGNGYTGATTSMLTINAIVNSVQGDYQCKISGDNAIDILSNTTTLAFTGQPAPTIALTGSALQSSPGDSYQWYSQGSIINGATTSILDINIFEYGVYKVDVTQNGCTAASADFIYLITAIDEINSQIRVYPNPVEDYFIIENQSGNVVTINVFDQLGIRLIDVDIHPGINRIQSSTLSTGLYFLKSKSDQFCRVVKLKKL